MSDGFVVMVRVLGDVLKKGMAEKFNNYTQLPHSCICSIKRSITENRA